MQALASPIPVRARVGAASTAARDSPALQLKLLALTVAPGSTQLLQVKLDAPRVLQASTSTLEALLGASTVDPVDIVRLLARHQALSALPVPAVKFNHQQLSPHVTCATVASTRLLRAKRHATTAWLAR